MLYLPFGIHLQYFAYQSAIVPKQWIELASWSASYNYTRTCRSQHLVSSVATHRRSEKVLSPALNLQLSAMLQTAKHLSFLFKSLPASAVLHSIVWHPIRLSLSLWPNSHFSPPLSLKVLCNHPLHRDSINFFTPYLEDKRSVVTYFSSDWSISDCASVHFKRIKVTFLWIATAPLLSEKRSVVHCFLPWP